MLNRAIARGELPPEVDQELLLDLLLGPLWFRLLLSGAPITAQAARSVVELVLSGAVPGTSTAPPSTRAGKS
jgi:hypothetical protein